MQVVNGILVDEMGVPIGSAPTPFGPMLPAMGQPQAAPPAQPPAPVASPPAQPMAPPAPAPAPVSGDLIPASDEPFDITQAEGYQDPKRALWGGILMDIGNFIGSAGQRPMQGLGPAFMMNAMNRNQRIQEREDSRQKTVKPQIYGDKQTGYFALGADGQVRELTKGAVSDETTNTITNLLAAGYEQGTPEFQDAMRRVLERPASSTTVNVGDKGNLAFTEKFREMEAGRTLDAIQAGETARMRRGNLQRMYELNENLDVTGTTGEVFLALKRELAGLGFEGLSDQAAVADAFRSLAVREQFALSESLKGPISDYEGKQMAISAGSDLGATTQAGRRSIISYQMGLAGKEEELARGLMGYRAQPGNENKSVYDFRRSPEFKALDERSYISFLPEAMQRQELEYLGQLPRYRNYDLAIDPVSGKMIKREGGKYADPLEGWEEAWK